jgi:alkanesulfonate monooxygenase SsuD/methylene tetrahydromethanopterin reductase-like flavin-dependent oxidoreductase (luciferase family)
MEEAIEAMRKAWTGEPFEFRGRTVRVTPAPPSPPMILIGGSTEKAAKRAAKLRAGFFPAIGDQRLGRPLQRRVRARRFPRRLRQHAERPRLRARVGEPRARLAAHRAARPLRRADLRLVADADQRSQMHVEGNTLDDVKKSGAYTVLTPDDSREARQGDRPHHSPPADGRYGAGPRMGEPEAVRREGAAADQMTRVSQ